ncbi:ribosome silencing factor [Actinomyces sp. B33]|uniref:ribosome silencing factor n=1 Tax=Actinomyces sp. B33 TaxID=2942131 RepID=UPI00233FE54D|nr:ribosome silencing factor [Actinomyces sp. B33]MDC4233131.1 ribosome silencing factor [Actinomyces sp. B33]
MTLPAPIRDLAVVAATAASDKLASSPVLVDVSGRLALADAFLVVSAPTSRQVRAIGEEIMDRLARERGVRPRRIEGRAEATWMLIDYGDLVVHVFGDEEREYYALEKLWGDGLAEDLTAEVEPGPRPASGAAVIA